MSKKIILAILFIGCTLPSTAQISLTELLGGRIKGNNPSPSIVTDALMPALSVNRQQYWLERDDKRYGKGSNPFYGENVSLAVKIAGATLLQRSIVVPWEEDEDYKRVNAEGKYNVKRSNCYQRQLTDSIWKTVDWELDSRYVSVTDQDSLVYMHEDTQSNFGLTIDDTPGLKQGYIVWAYSATNDKDSTIQVILKQNDYTIEASGDSSTVLMEPADAGKLIGGLFVVPIIERVGSIKILVVGMASKNKDGKWYLSLLTAKDEELTTIDAPEKKKTKQKKTEKSTNISTSTDKSEPTLIK